MGIAYDLFGKNRTAVKAAVNRYLYPQDFAGGRHPTRWPRQARFATSPTGMETSFPDCDHRNLFANQECGTADNTAFGSQVLNPPQFDPEVDTGFMNRPYSWEVSTGLQHHVMQGLGVEFGYSAGGRATRRSPTTSSSNPSDFKEFCVMVPTAAQANGNSIDGAGARCAGSTTSRSSERTWSGRSRTSRRTPRFGDEIWVFNGFEFNVNARMRGGLQLTGGTMTQRTRIESCYRVDSPMWSPTESRGALSTGRYFADAVRCAKPTRVLQERSAVPNDDQADGDVSDSILGYSAQRRHPVVTGPAYEGNRAGIAAAEILDCQRAQNLSAGTVALTVVEPTRGSRPT